MKKLDLNIEIDEKVLEGAEEKSVVKIAINWIGIMVARAANKPDATGKPTKTVGMDEQRRYNKVMNALEANKEGVAEMEDDDLDYIHRKFHQAETLLNRDTARLLTDISKKLDEAKNG